MVQDLQPITLLRAAFALSLEKSHSNWLQDRSVLLCKALPGTTPDLEEVAQGVLAGSSRWVVCALPAGLGRFAVQKSFDAVEGFE